MVCKPGDVVFIYEENPFGKLKEKWPVGYKGEKILYECYYLVKMVRRISG